MSKTPQRWGRGEGGGSVAASAAASATAAAGLGGVLGGVAMLACAHNVYGRISNHQRKRLTLVLSIYVSDWLDAVLKDEGSVV